jgi:hypothetical protein
MFKGYVHLTGPRKRHNIITIDYNIKLQCLDRKNASTLFSWTPCSSCSSGRNCKLQVTYEAISMSKTLKIYIILLNQQNTMSSKNKHIF